MTFSRLIARLAVLLSLTGLWPCPGVGAQTTLGNEADWDGASYIEEFGEPDTATYGQTFRVTAPWTLLESFTLHLFPLDNTDAVDFRLYVAEWDGVRARNPLLFESPDQTTTGKPGWHAYTFDTGGLPLIPGADYVAFLSAVELFNGVAGTARAGWTEPDTYPGGAFVFLNHLGLGLGAVTSEDWDPWFEGDLVFSARLSSAPAVPEPGTLALLLPGLATVSLRAYRGERRPWKLPS